MNTNNAVTKYSGRVYDPKLEEIIQNKDTELKELARKNAKHFAKQNLPAPTGDTLPPYTGEIKTGYEKLASEVLHHLQPEANMPEAKMEADHFREKDKNLEAEIKEREGKNRTDEYELGNHHHGNIFKRILLAVSITFIISIGEIIYNTKSFQISGDNMLFALLISTSVSIGVLTFSHMVPLLYKGAKNGFQKRAIVIGSLLLVTILFSVLAIFRSTYLANHDVHINPIYFVIVNLFFFVVSSLISYFTMPTWDEIKENVKHLKVINEINKRKKEIEQLKKEREEIKITVLERTKERLRIVHYANYANERICKMYFETLEVFKTTNLTFRTDRSVPECFSEVVLDPNIITITF